MSKIEFTSELSVRLIDALADDRMPVQAAKVSTIGSESIDAETNVKLIDYLIKNRHATPFEANLFKFYIKAPIFVVREFQRHRLFSYNELSARYTELKPTFYIPNRDRKLGQVGKPGHYEYIFGTNEQHDIVEEDCRDAYTATWQAYESMLDSGVSKEVARIVLPVGVYSEFYASCNARSLMNFLSLRTLPKENSLVKSFPQFEISVVADQMEQFFKEKMPITHASWDKNGRIAI